LSSSSGFFEGAIREKAMNGPDDEQGQPGTPRRRFKYYPYGPLRLRLVMPCVAVAAGVIVAVTRISGLNKTGDDSTSLLFFAGLALVVLGVIAFFVALWMAKRGI
jgi:LPXTG-motif cell wall-anchored protein